MSSFNLPTPARMAKVGSALVVLSSTIAGFATSNNSPKIAIAAMACGALGNFICNCFSDISQKSE